MYIYLIRHADTRTSARFLTKRKKKKDESFNLLRVTC